MMMTRQKSVRYIFVDGFPTVRSSCIFCVRYKCGASHSGRVTCHSQGGDGLRANSQEHMNIHILVIHCGIIQNRNNWRGHDSASRWLVELPCLQWPDLLSITCDSNILQISRRLPGPVQIESPVRLRTVNLNGRPCHVPGRFAFEVGRCSSEKGINVT